MTFSKSKQSYLIELVARPEVDVTGWPRKSPSSDESGLQVVVDHPAVAIGGVSSIHSTCWITGLGTNSIIFCFKNY